MRDAPEQRTRPSLTAVVQSMRFQQSSCADYLRGVLESERPPIGRPACCASQVGETTIRPEFLLHLTPFLSWQHGDTFVVSVRQRTPIDETLTCISRASCFRCWIKHIRPHLTPHIMVGRRDDEVY